MLNLASAYGQVGNTAISGNECWNAGQGPGGPAPSALCVNTVRGSQPNVAIAGAGITGSFTIGVGTAPNTQLCVPGGCNMLISSQPSAATITLPASPVVDGAVVRYCNVSAAAYATNAVSLNANTGQTLAVAATLTTLGAGICASVQWNLANATWYRVQ